MRRRLFAVAAKRPPWCSYLVAYLLIGVGVVLVDIGAGPNRGGVVAQGIGVTLAFVGLFIFIAALIYSVRFVLGLGGTSLQSDVCPTCGYDLTGNTSGTCPECGTPVPKERGQQRPRPA